jgi:hypothetical protein
MMSAAAYRRRRPDSLSLKVWCRAEGKEDDVEAEGSDDSTHRCPE